MIHVKASKDSEAGVMPSEKLLTAMGKYNEGLAKAGVLHEENEIEIRQIFEAEDVGAEFTPELRRQEAVVRAQALGLGAPRFEPGKTMVIAGVNESYTFENRVKIPSQWDRLVPHIGKVPGQIGQISYGVCWNFSP